MEKGFFQSVYDIVNKIPPGTVTTYGTIAALIGRPKAARIVGYAMHTAPGSVPSHRVVNKAGAMAPLEVFGSKELQRSMLESEGVTFLPNGCVDIKKHLWMG